MGTPTVVNSNPQASATSNSTTFTLNGWTAASVETGDEIYSFVTADGNGTLTTSSSGWTKIDQETNSTTVTQALFVFPVTDGSVDPTQLVVNNTASEQYSQISLVVRPTSGYTLNRITPTKSNGSSTNSNPASFTNNSGASQDFLVVVSRGGDSTVVATAAPTNYTDLITQAGGGTNGASTNTATRNITVANTSSEDPGTFTSNSEQWTCFTVGIYETATAASITAAVGSYSLTGTAATLFRAITVAADVGSYSLTGTAATLSKGRTLTGDVGSYALTGTAAGLLRSYILQAQEPIPAYDITGQAATLSKGGTLTAAPGSYALTGQTAGLLWGHAAPLDPGSYALTGTAASLLHGYYISATPGSYALTGVDATLTVGGAAGYTIPADPGSYTLTGTTASLLWGHIIPITPGAYALTGTAASLLRGYRLAADKFATPLNPDPGFDSPGQWTANTGWSVSGSKAVATATFSQIVRNDLSGTNGQTYLWSLTVSGYSSGSFAVSIGNANTNSLSGDGTVSGALTPTASANFLAIDGDGSLTAQFDDFIVGAADYSLTGVAASFSLTKAIVADPGAYTLSGVAATLAKGSIGVLTPGSYVITGTAANFLLGRAVVADPGSYAITGTPVALSRGYVGAADPGVYLITGTAVSFNFGRAVSPAPGIYLVTGYAASLYTGVLADLVPAPPELVIFRHNEAEIVRVPKLNAVAYQAFAATKAVVAMTDLGHIAPVMGSELHVWDAPSGYTPAYGDGFNWRSTIDGSVLW